MKKIDFKIINGDSNTFSSKDWIKFLEVCKQYAIIHGAKRDSEDFASYAASVKVQRMQINLKWVFADYFRGNYGDTRISKYAIKLESEHLAPTDFDFGNIIDDSEFSRPDTLYERKVKDDTIRQLYKNVILCTETFDQFIILILYKKGFKQYEISNLIGVSESRVAQIMKEINSRIKYLENFDYAKNLVASF